MTYRPKPKARIKSSTGAQSILYGARMRCQQKRKIREEEVMPEIRKRKQKEQFPTQNLICSSIRDEHDEINEILAVRFCFFCFVKQRSLFISAWYFY